MNSIRKSLLTLVALVLTGPAFAAAAAPAGEQGVGAAFWQDDVTLATRQRGCLSLDQAVEQVRRRHNGRIVSAETRVQGNREVHVIKVLTSDGKVKTERVPGCTRD